MTNQLFSMQGVSSGLRMEGVCVCFLEGEVTHLTLTDLVRNKDLSAEWSQIEKHLPIAKWSRNVPVSMT